MIGPLCPVVIYANLISSAKGKKKLTLVYNDMENSISEVQIFSKSRLAAELILGSESLAEDLTGIQY